MGDDFIKDEKCEVANPLQVLGLQVSISSEAVELWLDHEKQEQWLRAIERSMQRQKLSAAEAGKLAGRLNFATQ